MSFVIVSTIKQVTLTSILLQNKFDFDPADSIYDRAPYSPSFELANALLKLDSKRVKVSYGVFNSKKDIEERISKDKYKFKSKLKNVSGHLRIYSGNRSTDLDDWIEHTVEVERSFSDPNFSFNEAFEKHKGKCLYFEVTLI